jgi:hypothetical protein
VLPEPPQDGPSLTLDDAVRCTIRVAGDLEPRWSDRLRGLRIATEVVSGRATTKLSGELPDQAALMGVLLSLYNLGLALLSVSCAAAPRRPGGRPRRRPPGARAQRATPGPCRQEREGERDA